MNFNKSSLIWLFQNFCALIDFLTHWFNLVHFLFFSAFTSICREFYTNRTKVQIQELDGVPLPLICYIFPCNRERGSTFLFLKLQSLYLYIFLWVIHLQVGNRRVSQYSNSLDDKLPQDQLQKNKIKIKGIQNLKKLTKGKKYNPPVQLWVIYALWSSNHVTNFYCKDSSYPFHLRFKCT